MTYNSRFKDAPWYEGVKNEHILMVGLGGIGSNTLYNLIKTVPAKRFHLVDMDIVKPHNIGTQFFQSKQYDVFKVDALREVLKDFGYYNTTVYNTKYTYMYMPIMITGLDNMKTRKEAFEVWASKEDRQIFIDGRMKANFYQIYVVTPGNEDRYRETLFDDKEIEEGPCTFKQTTYVGMLIGARITQILVNYLTNYYKKENICEVPFLVEELTEAFYFKYEN